MKKILFLVLIMSSLNNYSQTYTTEAKALTGVFDVDGKSKAEIFSAINKWISINYNSGKSVTQLSDSEGGNIVVKGINEISYPNNSKILYPKMKSLPDNSIMKFNHLIEINIKENKYRIIYKIVEINYDSAVAGYLTSEMIKMNFDLVNLNGVPEAAMLTMSEFSDLNLKKGLIGQEKREQYKLMLKPSFNELNSNLLSEMKATMLSIQSAVTSTPTDGW